MEAILRQAREVGRMIAADERFVAFTRAAAAVRSDAPAQQLLKDYQTVMDQLRDMQQAGKPIEPEPKRRAADLQMQVATHDKLKDMLRTQADYVQLMQLVYSAIEESLAERDNATAPAR